MSASRAIAAIVLSPAPFTWTALRWPLLGFVGGFALFATLAALALATGGRPQSFGDIEVSSWFAWWVAGGCVAAIAALFVRERVGDAWWGALVWTLFLVALWAFVRRGRRRPIPEV